MNRLILIFSLLCLPAFQIKAQTDTSINKDTKKTEFNNLQAGKDSTGIDSTRAIADSLKPKSVRLIPIQLSTLNNANEFNHTVNKDEIEFTEYRNIADVISYYSPAFLRNLGTLGQPSELMIYGAGYDQLSYLKDGLLINNRLTNSFDLNNIQSESIDSIEIIPSIRGFLYGSTNNLSSVNFISKENFSIENKKGAYSRLRYYQSADEEAFIDAIFSTGIYKNLTGHFEITNATISNRFQNSEYGSWQGNASLRYIFSNSFNIVANYNYINSQTHLFGGIDVDSLSKINEEETSEYRFPVNSLYRYYKNTERNIDLRLLHKLSGSLTGDATFYSRYNFLEYRNDEFASPSSTDRIVYNNKTKVYGFALTENYNADFLSLYFNSVYERSVLDTYYWGSDQKINSFSVASRLNLFLADSSLIPSVFGKYLYQYSKSYFGFGGDATYKFSNNVTLYAGVSYFEKPFGFITERNINGDYSLIPNAGSSIKTTSVEAGLKLFQQTFSGVINIFYRNTEDELHLTTAETGYKLYVPIDKKLIGANLGLNYQLWRFNIESSLSGYYMKNKMVSSSINQRIYLLPEYTFNGGIYYKDILFSNNLNLKTGIRVSSVGFQQGYAGELDKSDLWEQINEKRYGTQYNVTLHPSLTLDFILIGEIQKRATIYFSFENLLDKKYFIVEGYYMPPRYIKLGVAWQFLN
ncbi:MAG: hypothetical protein C4539_10550 [Ignavibacteriales bacterium]|nr:MAG: hypothetical protein C4539_10550 [Ignavibacteriales bacterium]